LTVITADIGISASEAGLALTLMWIWYSLTQFPGGRMSDKLSRRTIIVFSLLLSVLGFLLVTVTATFGLFLFSVSLIGIGGGFYFVPMRALLSDLYVNDRGRIFGVNLAAGAFGSALAAGLVYIVLEVTVWQIVFLTPAILLAITALLMHVFSNESYVVSTVDLQLRETITRMLARTTIRRAIVVYSLFIFVFQGIISFLPIFLQSEKTFSMVAANTSFALIYVIGIFVMPVAGKFGDRFGYRLFSMFALISAILGLSLIVVTDVTVLIITGLIMFAAGIRSFSPLMQAYFVTIFPDNRMGGDFGATKTVYNGVGSLGPLYIGVVADLFNYTVSFASLIVFLVASLFVLWVGVTPISGLREVS
jgi:MFS family permease